MILRNGLIAAALLVAACGGGGGGATTATTAAVSTTNTAPTVSNAVADQTAMVGHAFNLDLSGTFTDADNDTLTVSADIGGTALGLTITGTTLSGVPNASGTFTVTCTATDPSGAAVSDSFTLTVTVDQNAVQAVFNGAIDLENLDDYAGQAVPNYITKINDGGNPITNAGATLGRVLFYDPSLSTTGTVSCASCHLQSLGFSDAGIVSTGVEGGQTGRHSMRLINTMFADETDFF
ncbi:MAG: cytochrome c peroxidase, partial [Pseudomonadota bacterium]